MLGLVLGALRRRRAQTVAVFALAVLLCAVAAGGPLFAADTGTRVTAAGLAAAPPAQRLLSVRQPTATGADPAAALAAFRTAVEQVMPGQPGAVLGLAQTLTTTTGGSARKVPVAYRDGVCGRLRITGACPAAPGEAVLSARAAATLGLRVGDDLVLRDGPSVRLRVTGTYERTDPAAAYWAEPLFGPGWITAGEETLDPAFTDLGTFAGDVLDGPTAAYTVEIPPQLFDRDGGVAAVGAALKDAGFDHLAPPATLLDAVAADRAAARRGILAGWAQALTLCLLAFGIIGRHLAHDRRADVALLKLRGATGFRTLRLAVLQHLLPMLAAVPFGLAATGAPFSMPQMSYVAAVSALVAGLGVLMLTELPVLRTSVGGLLQRVASRRRRGVGAAADVLLVVLAGFALYQAHRPEAARTAGVDLVAPVLVAFALAVLLARLVTALAGQAGRVALRAGRLPVALAALHYHRRDGMDRLFALVAVAVALLGLAASGHTAADGARQARSALELGAATVLTVTAPNHTALLTAVRQADPGGRVAMAVALDRDASPPVIAVDAGRYRAVTGRPVPHPVSVGAGSLPVVDGGSLTLRARNESGGPVRVLVRLVHTATGAATTVVLGPVPPGEHDVTAPVPTLPSASGSAPVSASGSGSVTVSASPSKSASGPVSSSGSASASASGSGSVSAPGTVSGSASASGSGSVPGHAAGAGAGCAAPGCRIVAFVLAGPSDVDGRPGPAAPGSALSLLALRQDGRVLLDGARLGDASHWRAAAGGPTVVVAARQDALTLRAPGRGDGDVTTPDSGAYAVDASLPVPAVLAGAAPKPWASADPALTAFGAGSVPLRVAGTAAVLPVLGAEGLLVDLDATTRALPGAGQTGALQVWLAPGASRQTVAALTAGLAAAGVEVTGTETAGEHSRRLAEHGPGFAVRFQLLAAVAGLLLAAVAAAVAGTVEQQVRTAELRASRVQGLPARAAVRAGVGGQAALLGFGLLGGLLVAVVTAVAAGQPVPVFADDWGLTPPPDPVQPIALAVAGLAALAVLATVAGGVLLSTARAVTSTTRAVTSGSRAVTSTARDGRDGRGGRDGSRSEDR